MYLLYKQRGLYIWQKINVYIESEKIEEDNNKISNAYDIIANELDKQRNRILFAIFSSDGYLLVTRYQILCPDLPETPTNNIESDRCGSGQHVFLFIEQLNEKLAIWRLSNVTWDVVKARGDYLKQSKAVPDNLVNVHDINLKTTITLEATAT